MRRRILRGCTGWKYSEVVLLALRAPAVTVVIFPLLHDTAAAMSLPPLLLRDNDTIAICGDSITELTEYSVFLETYLRVCRPAKNLRCLQFGWSGERADNFLLRMENDVLWLKPDVVTICYGMNDGGYRAAEKHTSDTYRKAMRGIIGQFQRAGVRTIVAGSPGAVDLDFYCRGKGPAEYNQTLAGLRDIGRDVVREFARDAVVFADIHTPMHDVMVQAKRKYGPAYHVCGPDGFHPARNGHLIMAYVFLRALGVDGEIGTINLDLETGAASASEGHAVKPIKHNSDGRSMGLEIESIRYPFCFQGDPADPCSTSGITQFLPFNPQLNRMKLVVANAAGRMRVTWGEQTREFSAGELAGGVNLADVFTPNPFSAGFFEVEAAVRAKQAFETIAHKHVINCEGKARAALPEAVGHFVALRAKTLEKHQRLEQAVAAAMRPVRHSITIEG